MIYEIGFFRSEVRNLPKMDGKGDDARAPQQQQPPPSRTRARIAIFGRSIGVDLADAFPDERSAPHMTLFFLGERPSSSALSLCTKPATRIWPGVGG